jgi:hypothetical protein
MFYTIYKTTNLVNGKFYIGKHKTKDLSDGYVGSGKLLKYAINKHGLENFHTEILHMCKSEKEMNILERILVVPDTETNYNLCPGGEGGFGFINSNDEIVARRDKKEHKIRGRQAANAKGAHVVANNRRRELLLDEEYKKQYSESLKKAAVSAPRKDCPHCGMKNLNNGNYNRHVKAKHQV